MAAASFFVMMFFDVLSSLVALIVFLFLTCFHIFDLLLVLISFHGLVFLWLSVDVQFLCFTFFCRIFLLFCLKKYWMDYLPTKEEAKNTFNKSTRLDN